MQCLLVFGDYEKTYSFQYSKDELKNRIVDAYSYKAPLLMKNLGKNLLENEQVNARHKQGAGVWLEKRSWNRFRDSIRSTTADTLHLLFAKHHSRTKVKFTVIVNGNAQTSSLTIKGVQYEQAKPCAEREEDYLAKYSELITNRFLTKLN